jgi:predicted ATPase
MKLVSLVLSNYKSVEQSGEIVINENVTILAGKNNTGKTSLIEAIHKIFNGQWADFVSKNPENPDISILEMVVNFNEEELTYIDNIFVVAGYKFKVYNSSLYKFLFRFNQSLNMSCILTLHAINESVKEPSPGRYIPVFINDSTGTENLSQISPKYQISSISGSLNTVNGSPNIIFEAFNLLKNRIVYISGARYVPNQEKAELHENLNINGTNLNAYLYSLHNNKEKVYKVIVNTFKRIFNDVLDFSTPINASQQTNISLYFEGLDKPIPLFNCGSGFTHVLMLLCVLYSQENRVVLFDEPHVYLHPSAEKAIYDLMSENNGHQYILTTHSPILINYPIDKNLYLVNKINGISTFTKLDAVGEILNDIGVSNSDFALSEKVLFVEGETEEIVIPMILGHFGMRQIGYSYRVLKMKGTGKEFSKKTAMQNNKDKLDLILGGISESPIPYMILIDLDEKDERKIGELQEKYGESLKVLGRREIENYFIDCYEQISIVINESCRNAITTPEAIEQSVNSILIQTENMHFYRNKGQINDPIKQIIGSRVLEQLFSEYGLYYNKVTHGVELVKCIIKNDPEKLMPIIELLEDFIKG